MPIYVTLTDGARERVDTSDAGEDRTLSDLLDGRVAWVKIRGGREGCTIWASTSGIVLIEQTAEKTEPMAEFR